MQAYNTQTGIVCPLDRANVDTDQIIAKQFLKSIKRTGFGVNLFDDWRYLDEGYPGHAETLAVARAVSMRLGHFQNMAFVRLLRQVLPIFFITTALKTGCCPSC